MKIDDPFILYEIKTKTYLNVVSNYRIIVLKTKIQATKFAGMLLLKFGSVIIHPS